MFATCGSDTIVRVYDEMTRKLVTELSGAVSGKAGHSLKVISCKFDKDDENILVSGGWDHTIQVWDLREGQSVRNIYGPKIYGDAIDVHEGLILTGSCRPDNQLQTWFIGTGENFSTIDWNEGGELGSPDPCSVYSCQFQKDAGSLIVAGGAGYNEVKIFDHINATGQISDYRWKPIAQINELSRACYSTDFSNKNDMIAMGGGDGVVRVFNVNKE